MDAREVVEASPRELEISDGTRAASYERADDLVASHGGASASSAPTAEGVGIAVAPVDDPVASEGESVGPVYRQVQSGELAIPTGRILVRFPDGESAAEHESQLADAGFVIDEVLSYAPQAAWVRCASGVISEALRTFDRLTAIPGVEHVEPQIVSRAHAR